MGGRTEELRFPSCASPLPDHPMGVGAEGLGFALKKKSQSNIPSMQNLKKLP